MEVNIIINAVKTQVLETAPPGMESGWTARWC